MIFLHEFLLLHELDTHDLLFRLASCIGNLVLESHNLFIEPLFVFIKGFEFLLLLFSGGLQLMVISPYLVKVFDLVLKFLVLKDQGLVILVSEFLLLIATLCHHLGHLVEI